VTSLSLYTCMQLCLPLVSGFVDDVVRNMVASVSEPLIQLITVAFRFCVMSSSVET